jgi:predicted ATPase
MSKLASPHSQGDETAGVAPLVANRFVGRQQEMDQLKAALEDVSSGQGQLVMLAGEPGIGKSRTLQEFADYAREGGALPLWGLCYENPGAPPYWPWVQVLRSYTLERDAETLYQDMGRGAPDIAEIVPEVREQLPGLPTPAAVGDPEQARFRLFNSITTFFKTATRRQPLALFLDNLHWADKPSLLLLEFLAQEMAHSRLLVLGTYRNTEMFCTRVRSRIAPTDISSIP